MTETTTNEELATSTAGIAKKDKKAIINETFSDVQLQAYFTLLPPEGMDRDYHILERAYRGLPAPEFARFVDLFVASGRNLQARGPSGTMLEVISTHRRGTDYAEAIKKHL